MKPVSACFLRALTVQSNLMNNAWLSNLGVVLTLRQVPGAYVQGTVPFTTVSTLPVTTPPYRTLNQWVCYRLPGGYTAKKCYRGGVFS